MSNDIWTLMRLGKNEIYRVWPTSRRFLDLGFDLNPRLHGSGILGLSSPNQTIRLTLDTGEIEHVAVCNRG